MRRFSFLFGLTLGLVPALAVSQESTIWSCRDKDGHTHVTNLKDDTVGKNCRIVQQSRVQVVPVQKPAKSPDAAPATAFPTEDTQARAAARERQREILEKELKQEESLLDQARKELQEQESVRSGDERNYARVLERLQKYKDAVELHEKNVESLRRELANLYR